MEREQRNDPGDPMPMWLGHPGAVHGVNAEALASAAGRAHVSAVRSAMVGAGQIEQAEAAYRSCAMAFAVAREAGASVRSIAHAVADAARAAGIDPQDAQQVGLPFPISNAAVQATAYAGRFLQLPGRCPISCRSLVRLLTRAYNTAGGSKLLDDTLSRAIGVDEAITEVRDFLANAPRPRRMSSELESLLEDAQDQGLLALLVARKVVQVARLNAERGTLSGQLAGHLVGEIWIHLAAVDKALQASERPTEG